MVFNPREIQTIEGKSQCCTKQRVEVSGPDKTNKMTYVPSEDSDQSDQSICCALSG